MRGLTESRLCRTATPQGNSTLRGKGHTCGNAPDFTEDLCSMTPPG